MTVMVEALQELGPTAPATVEGCCGFASFVTCPGATIDSILCVA